MTARCVMVLGTTSGAGKSLLATALCRWYARQGWTVRIVVGLLTGLFVLAIIVLSLRISFGPSVFDRIQSIF